MQPIPTHGGLGPDDDLRALIRETLQRRGVKVNAHLVEDIYTLVIKTAANSQYQELRRIVADKINRLNLK